MSTPNPKLMRVVPAVEPEPMTIDEVQANGNRIAKQVRTALIRAIQTGMSERTFKDKWSLNDIRIIREQARLAVSQWQEVEALAADILDPVDRARKAQR